MALYVLIAALLAGLAFLVTFRRITVFEYERGVRYRRGRSAGVLGPGVHWIAPVVSAVVRVDVRPAYLAVPGQEVLTADGIGLKITIVAKYQVTDPERALNAVAGYRDALYTQLQLALREIVGAAQVDAVLAGRMEMGKQLVAIVAPRAAEFGITIAEAEVKDVMFPGDLKKIFAQVVRARQEGLAALERARGESAALRNLVNAAALVEQRPSLLQLRLLQTVGQTTGNTVVLGMSGTPPTVPLRPEAAPRPELPGAAEEET
jgi:regulator of protease activity HflC (stomatin/prohibitin superfamily)